MRDLGIEHTIAIYTVLINEGGAIFTEVMKDLYNMWTGQNLLQVAGKTMVEWIYSHHIKYIAVVFEAKLN